MEEISPPKKAEKKERCREHLEQVKYNCKMVDLNPIVLILAEKAMAPHSSILTWKIPWMEEPGRLQSMESLRVRHD